MSNQHYEIRDEDVDRIGVNRIDELHGRADAAGFCVTGFYGGHVWLQRTGEPSSLTQCFADIDYAIAFLKTQTADASPVDHPKHYNSHPSGVECIDVVEWMSFNVGNAIKYIWRHRDKGQPIEDLRKAVWYINREIQRMEKSE